MNRDHRRIIHELAQVYGLESVSYDSEPKRNVVVIAVRWVGLAIRNCLMEQTTREAVCQCLLSLLSLLEE